MMRGEQKIGRSHLDRTAVIYLRQSTMMQVREHGESTARQYGLAGEAARLGWSPARIEVIDCDLGLSGRTATHREGFRALLGRVCAGEAGAIFGLEISRLARSSADLSRLLEIARLTDTLVVDADGVYDLADINDRLLLGLKGQMSEAELHFLHTRLDGARQAAAARGDLRLPLPVGYAYDDGQVVKDPDEEVAAAITDMFAAFTATGSAYGVVTAFAGRRFPAGRAGDRAWGRLTYSRVVGLLHNPVYAGAYAFGRHRTRQQVDADGGVHASTRAVARDQWQVLIPDHHEGYISWQDYLAIEDKMAANQSSAGARPPREGSALCQGIIYCGCGRHMSVSYHDDGRAYYSCRARPDQQATPGCQHASAATIDAAVTGALFTAIAPAELALAIAAAGEVTDRRQRATRAAELAVARASYQADRAERAFSACEPENRLVARTLETRWETRLTELADTQAALAAQLQDQAPLPGPRELRDTAASLPALWHAPTTSSKDRKRLLRTLLGDITIMPAADPAQLRIGLRWNSGATEELLTARHYLQQPRRPDHGPPARPRHGQQNPRRRPQRRRPPHRHRTPLRHRLSRQPAHLSPHRLPPARRRRRAHHHPGRRPARRLRQDHPVLDRPRLPHRTTRTRRALRHPLHPRHRSHLPPARRHLLPPAQRHPDRTPPRRRAQHHRNRGPARRQTTPHLRPDQARHPASPPRTRRPPLDHPDPPTTATSHPATPSQPLQTIPRLNRRAL
jgi:DNA invertase Pin-like site-specific DNA recombinase